MSSVYKYCSPEGLAILDHLELKITPPNQFNDPFEFTPRMIATNPLGKATSILLDKRYRKVLYHHFKNTGRFQGSYGEFSNYVKMRGSKMAKDLSQCIPMAASGVKADILDKFSREFGVLCLSKNSDSILMWGHYCKSHTGIVIGFDDANPIFHPNGERGLTPVTYVRQRALFDATWPESDKRVEGFTLAATFSKNDVWAYEEESRQVFKLGPLKTKPLENGTPGFFLPIPPLAISSVSFGVRCTPSLTKDALKILESPQFRHVKIERAELHDSDYSLCFETIRLGA